jgi:hypothetical protein
MVLVGVYIRKDCGGSGGGDGNYGSSTVGSWPNSGSKNGNRVIFASHNAKNNQLSLAILVGLDSQGCCCLF